MRLRMIYPIALVAMAGAVPALAQTYYAPQPGYAYPAERIYVPGTRAHGAIHGGWVNPGDDQLLADTMAALQSDPRLDNLTLTIVAKNGELIMNGTAKNGEQAAYVERVAKRIANGHVTALWATQLG
jgi:hypothetical protein